MGYDIVRLCCIKISSYIGQCCLLGVVKLCFTTRFAFACSVVSSDRDRSFDKKKIFDILGTMFICFLGMI